MAGYYQFRPATGMLDPLFAKAIVVEQDETCVALVALDLALTTKAIVDAAREAIQDQCGIAGGNVMISATHTHTGPQLARGSLMDDITKANSPAGLEYMNALPGSIARAVKEAKEKLTPATAAAAIGDGKGISFNRRMLRNGSTNAIWQPKKINPATERPAGPVDPDIGILVFQTDGKPAACYLNFAMHPTSIGGGLKISADYPGVFTKLVSTRHAPGAVCAFANGCCGNINATDYFTGRKRTTRAIGTALANAATAAWPNLQPLSTFRPRVRSELVTLKRRTFDGAEIARAKDITRRMLTNRYDTVTMAKAVCIMETVAKQDVPLVAEVQVIALGDELAVVGLPGEIFVELGLAIKKGSPFKYTFIAEQANGGIGYVPNREAYPQGQYEIVSARGEAGSGEILVETALKLLGEVKAAK